MISSVFGILVGILSAAVNRKIQIKISQTIEESMIPYNKRFGSREFQGLTYRIQPFHQRSRFFSFFCFLHQFFAVYDLGQVIYPFKPQFFHLQNGGE